MSSRNHTTASQFAIGRLRWIFVRARDGLVTALVVALYVLLSATASVRADDAAELRPRMPEMPSMLVQLVDGNSRITDVRESKGESRDVESDYRVDTGDRVSVMVYQEPDLSVTGVRVNANGTISYPLLGDLRVSGLTSQEVHDLIRARLLDGYLKQPSLTVSVDSYRMYFIKGEVQRPGGYSFVDGLTVAKAVALAGGYTVRASEGKITLVRESNPENPIESAGPNTAIRPGDIITVGESFF